MSAGRPFNEEKFAKFIKMLKAKPRSASDVVNKLKIGRRTVYNWLARAEEEGYEVVRIGFNPTKHLIWLSD